MLYLSAAETAKLWNVSELSVRNYCAQGRVAGAYNIVPFIIEDDLKIFYYRGLKEWDHEKGYLTDTCLAAQDKYKTYLDYFRIRYPE